MCLWTAYINRTCYVLTRVHNRLEGYVALLKVKGEFVHVELAGAHHHLVIPVFDHTIVVDAEIRTRRGFILLCPVWEEMRIDYVMNGSIRKRQNKYMTFSSFLLFRSLLPCYEHWQTVSTKNATFDFWLPARIKWHDALNSHILITTHLNIIKWRDWVGLWVWVYAYICQTYISTIVISGIHKYAVGIVISLIPQNWFGSHLMYSFVHSYTGQWEESDQIKKKNRKMSFQAI